MNHSPYRVKEEVLHAITHGVGVLLGIAGLVLLILKAVPSGNMIRLFSAIVFGLSIIILYLNSTLYHSFPWKRVKHLFKIFDHISIYILIAGTYTPFMLITLKGVLGTVIISVIWGLTFIGIVFKIFFVGRFRVLSTLMYVMMGWMAIFAVKPLLATLPTPALLYLILGGVMYTVGVVFYLWEKIPYHHAIWHLFVLAGTIFHFFSIYLFVL